MKYRVEDDTLTLTVTELAAYAYGVERPAVMAEKYGFRQVWEDRAHDDDPADMRPMGDSAAEGIRLHNQLETDRLTEEAVAGAEVELAYACVLEELKIELHGRSDSISFDGDVHTVEECKTVSSFRDSIGPFTSPAHFVQAVCYGFMVCRRSMVNRVKLRITFVRRADGMRKSFQAVFGYALLSSLVEGMLRRALPFLRIEKDRIALLPEELKKLPFPYPSVRPGQQDFIKEAYRTIRHGGRLFVSAPCGIGKTMSGLYPALRAVGQGLCDRVFYCTAKTITGKAALDAAARLATHAPHLRAILLLAKESLCTAGEVEGETALALKCPICPDLHAIGFEKTYRSFQQRRSEALLELLTGGQIYTPEKIKEVAAAHQVCPHELSLDLSEYCDLIVCDYNYIFDDRMRLRRYFKDVKRQEQYVFLIDEAHNLPDRARAMYSASLTNAEIRSLRQIRDKLFSEDEEFDRALTGVENWFRHMEKRCMQEAVLTTESGVEKKTGYYRSATLPPDLSKRFGKLTAILSRYIRDKHEFAGELVNPRQALLRFAGAADYGDERFAFLACSSIAAEESELEGDAELNAMLPSAAAAPMSETTVQILCLDPGGILDTMLHAARATLFFSATMAPGEYYQSVTGSEGSVYLDLPSPYDKENLCLVAYDGISTRYSDRRGTAEETAELIARAVEACEGHYLVYFPSYAYMRSVCRAFREIAPPVQIIVQKSGMSYKERERFLRAFESGKYPHLVGFCVLGGMFSEGIDLRGNSLIGAIIVGTGLPGLSVELNLTAEYYQNKSENGREFAYIYPGMNKVLQAAGRVIRSETDRGMVLLIDDRYREPGMRLLFPAHWQHMKFTADPDSLERILGDFWDGK